MFDFGHVVMRGVVTDVRVLFSGGVERTSRHRHIRASTENDDAMEEIEADGVPETVHVSAPDSTLLKCRNCSKRYKQRRAIEEHGVVYERTERDRSVLARGTVMAMEMLHLHDIGVYKSEKAHPHLAGIAVEIAIVTSLQTSAEWAVRTKQGSKLGANTTKMHMGEMEHFFCGGAVYKGNNMSDAMMREALMTKCPRPCEISLEQNVNGSIQTMFDRGLISAQGRGRQVCRRDAPRRKNVRQEDTVV